MNTSPISYKRHRFRPQIIAHAVWLYFRFPLSLRLVEEMLLERGIIVGDKSLNEVEAGDAARYYGVIDSRRGNRVLRGDVTAASPKLLSC